MNSFRVRFFLCCLPVLFANGCDSTDPCGGTCDLGQVCIAGICETSCDDDDDDDCAPGQFCVDGRCGESCDTGDDCECDSDADCDDQTACSTDTCAGNLCINTPISCNTAGDCPTGCNVSCNALFFCSNTDPCASCTPDQICINGACVECEITADCLGANELCVDGSCVACNDNNACTSDIRVVDDQTVEFVCTYNPSTCATVFQCPPGCNTACLSNFCVN